MIRKFALVALCVAALMPVAIRSVCAHDTWVESGALLVRPGDYLYIDLRLGNHGNNHRDFKLASKITLEPCKVVIVTPDGSREDLKEKLIDVGNAPKEGYWSARYVANTPGVYEVVHTLDTLHGKIRAIKSSKTYFVAGYADGKSFASTAEVKPPHGLKLELQLETAVEELQARKSIKVRLLREGKPVADSLVSFIPRGVALAEGEDPNYEKKTDSEGRVEFTPQEGNLVLAVAHVMAENEKGEGYDKTHYAATLVLPIPQQSLSNRK